MRSRLLPISLILAFVCFGCGRGGQGNQDEPVHVLATVYALADIAREIGGDRVRVEWFVENGQSLNELSETPERRQQLRTAELIVTRGAPDPWTLEGAGDAYQDRRLIRLDALASTRDADPSQYLWLDPRTALEVADELTTRLSALRPKSENYFKGNASRFRQKVAELTEQTSRTINRTSGGGPFVTLDRGFLPLARRFGLEEVRVENVLPSYLNPFTVNRLRNAARDAGAGAVFLSSETAQPLVREWQGRLGMPVFTLDPLGTSAPTGRSTYLVLLHYNLQQLMAGTARSRPTTATTRYLAETVERPEELPPPTTTSADDTTPSPVQGDTSGIKVQPIPNPYGWLVRDPTTRPLEVREPTTMPTTQATVLLPAMRPPPSLPAPPPVRPRPRLPLPLPPQSPFDPGGIRVPPMPNPYAPAPDQQPTTRPHNGGPATLPSPGNPFAR
jgi:zinc transport system substrate-binding protein